LELSQELANKLSKALQERQLIGRPVAVLRFQIVGQDEGTANLWSQRLAVPLQDDLTTMLLQAGVRTVERAQLDRAIEEIQRAQQGLTDYRLALRLGKMVPGTLALVGSISLRENRYWVLHTRLLETEKGQVLLGRAFVWDREKNQEVALEESPLKDTAQLAQELARRLIQKGENKPIAVAPFRVIGMETGTEGLVKPLQEDLTTLLAQNGISVVERSQLEQALQEIGLAQKGLTAEQGALELGKFVPGVRVLVGSILPAKPSIVNVRVVKTETAEVLVAIRKAFSHHSLTLARLVRTLTGHTGSVLSVTFSPDGQFLASGSEDNTVKIWRVSDGKETRTLTGHILGVNSVAFSPDGQFLASGSTDKTVKIWRVSDGSLVRTLTGHTDLVYPVAFSPDGQFLASGSLDKTVKLWRVSDGKEVRTLTGHKGSVYSVAFSPDGQFLASGSLDNTVKIWRVSDGSLVRTLTGHTDPVRSVAFSPDGQFLASGSLDKTVKIWRVSDGKEVRTLTGHKGSVYSVAFSPDGQFLASGSSDDTVKIWRISSGSHFPYEIAEKLAVQLLESLRRRGVLRPTAVALFQPLGVSEAEQEDLRTGISIPFQEDLTTALVQQGLPVVERVHVDRILAEIAQGKTGLTDQQLAIELGRFMPGSWLVVGSFSRRGDKWVITARLLETERGEGIAAAIAQTEL